MRAIDVYFCAINVKGRRWIPAPEALDLCQHCHNICDPGRNVEICCCLEDVGLEDVGHCKASVLTAGGIYCTCSLVSPAELANVQAEVEASCPTRDWAPLMHVFDVCV